MASFSSIGSASFSSVADTRSTHGFEQQVAWLARQTSKSAVTQLMRVAWRTVGEITARFWADAENAFGRFDGLSRIGIDEVSYRRGRLFLMVVVDHDTGRVVWVGKGQSKATLQEFFDALGPSGAPSSPMSRPMRRRSSPRP